MKNQKKNPQQLNEAVFLLPVAVWGLKALAAYMAWEMVVGAVWHDSVTPAAAATLEDGYKQRMLEAYKNQAEYFNKNFPKGPKQFKKKYPNNEIPGGVRWKEGKEKGVFDRWLDVNDSVWNTNSAESYWEPHGESWLKRTEWLGYNKNSQRKVGIFTGPSGKKEYFYEGDFYRATLDRDFTPGGDPEKRKIGRAKRSLGRSLKKIRAQMDELKASNPEAYQELQAQYNKKVKEINSLGPDQLAKMAAPVVGKGAEKKAGQIVAATVQAVKKSKELEKTKNNQSQDKGANKSDVAPDAPSQVDTSSSQVKTITQPKPKKPVDSTMASSWSGMFEQYFKDNQQILEQIENKKLYNLVIQEVELYLKNKPLFAIKNTN